MRGIRWLPVGAAMAVVALSAPTAGAQEKQPTANGTGGAAASVDPLATQAAIDVLAAGGNAFDAAIAAAERARRGRALQLRHRRRRLHGLPRRRDGQDQHARLAREVARGDGAEQLLHRRQGADRRAVQRQPLQRPARPACPARRTPGRTSCASTAPTRSRTRSPTARRSPREGFTVDKTFFDQTTPNIAVLRRHPVVGGDLPRPRRDAEGRRHGPPQPRPRQDLRAHRPPRRQARASTPAPSPTRSSRRPPHRRPPRPPTTRGGPA